LRDRRDHLVDAHADEPHGVELVAFVDLPAERREAEEHPERRQTGDRPILLRSDREKRWPSKADEA
jgi:hypothetical protein